MMRNSTRSSVLTTWLPPFEAGFHAPNAFRALRFIPISLRHTGKKIQYFVDRAVIPMSYGSREPSRWKRAGGRGTALFVWMKVILHRERSSLTEAIAGTRSQTAFIDTRIGTERSAPGTPQSQVQNIK